MSVFLLGSLTLVIGNLVGEILLAWVDTECHGYAGFAQTSGNSCCGLGKSGPLSRYAGRGIG